MGMVGIVKRFTFIVFWIFLFVFLTGQVLQRGILVEDNDTTNAFAYKLIFPNDAISVAGAVGTVVFTGVSTALDDVLDPDANVSIDIGAFTVTIDLTDGSATWTFDGTTADCVFDDGDITCGSFTSSGSNPMVTCTNAGTVGMDAAGEICYNSTTDLWEYWDNNTSAKEQLVGEDTTQTLTNKTIDATDGTNTLIVTETKYIRAGELLNRHASEVPGTATNICSADQYLPGQFRTYPGDSTVGAQFFWNAPHDLDAASGIKFQLVLLQSSDTEAADTEVAQFEIYGCSVSANEQADCTVGAATELSATPSGTDILDNSSEECDLWYTDQTSALTSATITGLAAGEVVRIVLWRDHDDAGDTYVQTIGVVGVIIEYKLTKDNTL